MKLHEAQPRIYLHRSRLAPPRTVLARWINEIVKGQRAITADTAIWSATSTQMAACFM